MEQLVRLQGLLYVVVQVGVFDIAEVGYAEKSFGFFRALFGNCDRLVLSVYDVVPVLHFKQNGLHLLLRRAVLVGKLLLLAGRRLFLGVLFVVVEAAAQGSYELVDVLIKLAAFAAASRNNQRGTRFVD